MALRPGFETLWQSILDDCGMEIIPELKLRALALLAGEEELRFLAAEHERIHAEWKALIESGEDAGDGSDEYWRASVSVTKAIEYTGAHGAAALSQLVERRNRRPGAP